MVRYPKGLDRTKGDFAEGERQEPVPDVEPDFARGERKTETETETETETDE